MPPVSSGQKRRPGPRSQQRLNRNEFLGGVAATKHAINREAKHFKERRAKGQKLPAGLGELHSRHDAQRAHKIQQEDQDSGAQTKLNNYRPTLLLVLAQFATMLMLALPLFGEPSAVSAVLISGEEMVGLLRRCRGTQCTDWLQREGVASSAGAAGQAESAAAGDSTSNELLRRQSLPGASGTSPSDPSPDSSGSTSGSVEYDSLAGTMILVVFWTTFYCLLFTAIRYPLFIARPRLPPWIDTRDGADDDDGTARPKDEESQDDIADDRTRWERFKLFGYRAGRAMQVTNALMMPIAFLLVAVFVVKSQGAAGLSGLDGIGGGLYLLSFALIGIAYCTAVEFARNDGRLRRWLSFGFFLSKIPWCRDSSDLDEKRVPKQGEQDEDEDEHDPPPKYSIDKVKIDRVTGRKVTDRVMREVSGRGRGGRV